MYREGGLVFHILEYSIINQKKSGKKYDFFLAGWTREGTFGNSFGGTNFKLSIIIKRRKRVIPFFCQDGAKGVHGHNFVAESGRDDSRIFSRATQKLLYRAILLNINI